MHFRFGCFLLVYMFFGGTYALHAQGDLEALRYSKVDVTGSARIMGMGGSGSALGADLSAGLLNPAGLAQLRRNEFLFTPSFGLQGYQSNFLDNTANRNTSSLAIQNAGFAVRLPNFQGFGRNRREATSGLKFTTISVGYQRLADYNRETRISDFNSHSSITDEFAASLNGRSLTNEFFPETASFGEIAWNVLAANPVFDQPGTYFGSGVGGNLEQSLRIQESGNRGIWYGAAGFNFDDKVYVGASLQVLTLRTAYKWRFEEEDINNVHSFYEDRSNSTFPLEFPMNTLLATDSVEVRGTGVSGNLGIIFKPQSNLRVGLSIQLPGLLTMNESYRREMQHGFTLQDQFGQDSLASAAFTTGDVFGNYRIVTPYSFTLGGTYVIAKRGLVNIDLEVIDYSSMRLRSVEEIGSELYYSYDTENNTIQELYQPAVNLRIGGEFRSGDLRVRLGGGYLGSPLSLEARQYEDPEDLGNILTARADRWLATTGIGYRGESAFIDLAFQHMQSFTKQSVYTSEAFDPTLTTQLTRNQIILTCGVKWH